MEQHTLREARELAVRMQYMRDGGRKAWACVEINRLYELAVKLSRLPQINEHF
jgi:hypothetical protein